MVTRVFCDRCNATGRQMVTLLGVELCPRCVDDFRAWAVPKRHIHRKSERWQEILGTWFRSNKTISPSELAVFAGCRRETAHWQLNYRVRSGEIRRVRPGVYCLPGEGGVE